MNRRDFFFRQLVTESDLDGAFDQIELADRAIIKDLGLTGIAYGLGVAQSSPVGMSAVVAAGGAYDAEGQRIYLPSQQTLSLSVDANGVSTAVGNNGNAKVISVFASFARANSDLRTDGASQPVYFRRDESFGLTVRQGAEALSGAETPPALESDKILLADIRRVFGQTTITTADINPAAYTYRRQDAFNGLAGTVLDYHVGTVREAIDKLRDAIYEGVLSPDPISGTLTDYAPTGYADAEILRVNPTAASILRSMGAPAKPGKRYRIFNIATNTAYTITLNHQDGNGTAAQRFIGPNQANHVIRAGGSGSVWYDGTSSRWRVEAA